MRRPSRPLVVAAAGVVLAFVIVCGVLVAARPAMTQQAIEQRAVEIAKTEYGGVITNVTSQRTLQGPNFCSRWETAAARALYLLRLQSWDNCNPNQIMWNVRLEGDFTWPGGGRMRTMEMTLVSNGDEIGAGGELIEEAQP